MHDIHEANRIAQIILEYVNKHQLRKLTNIEIELGSVIEHGQDILPENLEFNLKMILKDLVTESTKINITKVKSGSWKLVSIEGA
jgi:Zn finger protein HypA/HybF involved in hydrogenase expression